MPTSLRFPDLVLGSAADINATLTLIQLQDTRLRNLARALDAALVADDLSPDARGLAARRVTETADCILVDLEALRRLDCVSADVHACLDPAILEMTRAVVEVRNAAGVGWVDDPAVTALHAASKVLGGELCRLQEILALTLPPTDTLQYVTLDQAAAIVSRSKRTLEKFLTRKKNPLPGPAIQGMGGKASEWAWAELRPWLEEEYGKRLPESYPAARPVG